MTQALLRSAFTPFGTIIDISMDNPRKWALMGQRAGLRLGRGRGWGRG